MGAGLMIICTILFASAYVFAMCYFGITAGPQDNSQIENQLRKQVNILQNDRWDRQSRLGKDYWSPNPLKKD